MHLAHDDLVLFCDWLQHFLTLYSLNHHCSVCMKTSNDDVHISVSFYIFTFFHSNQHNTSKWKILRGNFKIALIFLVNKFSIL